MRSPVFGHNNQHGPQTHQIKLQNLPPQSHPEQQLHVNVTFMVMYVRVIVGRRAAHQARRIIVSVQRDSRTPRRAAPWRESRKKQWVPRREEQEGMLASPAQAGGVARRECGAQHTILYRNTSHFTTPHHTGAFHSIPHIPHHTGAYHTTPHDIPHHITAVAHTTSQSITTHHTTSYHTSPRHTVPHNNTTVTPHHTTTRYHPEPQSK